MPDQARSERSLPRGVEKLLTPWLRRDCVTCWGSAFRDTAQMAVNDGVRSHVEEVRWPAVSDYGVDDLLPALLAEWRRFDATETMCCV